MYVESLLIKTLGQSHIPSYIFDIINEKYHGKYYHGQEAGAIYSHHQKSVIVDADASQNRRKIIAFVGGLDLCDGRYDTPEHTLFRTLQTVHKDDYHQPNFTVSVLFAV